MQRFSTVGRWVLDRGVILAAALVATAASLIASYNGLCGVAALAGWSVQVRPMLPLTVDVIAIACGVLVQRSPDNELRAVAWRGVVTAAVVSIAGNATDHLWTIEHSGGSKARVAIAIIVSVIPAVGIAYVIHLLALMTPTPAAEAATVPTPDDELAVPADEEDADDTDDDPQAELFPFPKQEVPRSIRQGTMKARGLALIAEAGRLLTTDELVEALGCTVRYAQMIREEATA